MLENQNISEHDAPVLEISGLRKTFGRTTALDGIDISLAGPGVYGFLGPNGAGKTTTFKLVCGLLEPTGGTIRIDGDNVRAFPLRVLSKLGVQFDGPVFYPHLTGRENLRVIACWLGLDLDERISRLLELVDLAGAADRRAGGYSFGMQRRLGLASALISDPRLLLLDEPTSGLDPAGIAGVRRLLPHLAREQGRCVFLSSHRMEEVEQVCDRVFIIHHGRIVAAGTPEDLASGENLVEIQCENALDARRVLENVDGVLQVEQVASDRLEVLAPQVRSARINQILAEHGVVAEQILKKRESLEDVFFRLTERGGNGGGVEPDAGGVSR